MKLVLLDRDGVINEDLETSVRSVSQFKLLPNVSTALKRLKDGGMNVAIVTNQAVDGRGELSSQELDRIHEFMCDAIESEGGKIDRIYIRESTDVDSDVLRKPGPGMILEAMQEFGAAPEETIILGDALRDLQAAKAACCKRGLVLTAKGTKTFSEEDLDEVKPLHVFNKRRGILHLE